MLRVVPGKSGGKFRFINEIANVEERDAPQDLLETGFVRGLR